MFSTLAKSRFSRARSSCELTGTTLKSAAVDRDRAVAAACAGKRAISADECQRRALEISRSVWTDGMSKELQFNSDKKLDRKLASLSKWQEHLN